MLTGGCDIGSLTSKAMLLSDGKPVGQGMIRSLSSPKESAEAVMALALASAGAAAEEVSYWVGTGYGREKIPYAQETVSEIACHARGARWMLPTARTVIDIGGQDCKAIRIDEDGSPAKFVTNDKCASGTGRFLEVMAKVLGLSLEELGELSFRSKNPVVLANACTVWAQADVIQHLHDGVPVEDIAAGINNAMAGRMTVLLNVVGVEKDVCMTGGVAKNPGVTAAIESLAGVKLKKIRKIDPQMAGAAGAAVIAWERVR
ncbi:MAG TPA: 2-hydroxyglutaryl-CoA dehydratase [Spirochaetes bacterium]|nr:2-hydroxyglutaryl-CoA dehydratase [Spirochaetota bacterium]